MAVASAGLTDLHCHILPAIDDGATDLEQSTAMARVALAEGITRLAATPHNLRWPPGTDRAALEARIAALTEHLAGQGLNLSIVAGAENVLLPAVPQQLDAGDLVRLNGSQYILLEPPAMGLPHGLEEIIFQVQVRGYVPILAHPERNDDLQRQPDRLRGLVERGMLVQITAGSLEGHFGAAAERAAQRLLEGNLVHVIASDAHGAHGRAPRLARARDLAARIVGPERAQAMVAGNPAAILDDLSLDLELPQPVQRRRWFWQRQPRH